MASSVYVLLSASGRDLLATVGFPRTPLAVGDARAPVPSNGGVEISALRSCRSLCPSVFMRLTTLSLSRRSLKELSKAINVFIVRPTVPLPDHLLETLAAYIRRHEKYDDAASDRLQEDLLVTFSKHVKGNPSASGAWFGIIRRLFPVLQKPHRILQWFDVCRGMWESSTLSKGVVDETMAGLMDLITLAVEYQDASEPQVSKNPFIDRLFFQWVDRAYPTSVVSGPSWEYAERLIRDALNQFGKKRPKVCRARSNAVTNSSGHVLMTEQEFFTAVDGYFVNKQYRKATVRFLCEYIQGQPPHLHVILDTPIFNNLLTCLHTDTSTTVVSAALTALIMLLPHMPSSLVPYLPSLFNIYARLLFWGRESPKSSEPRSLEGAVGGWAVCEHVPGEDDHILPQLSKYYTILYGLYPINFMDYIRKPQRYLRHANVSDANNFEVQPSEIRHKSESFARRHILHPNFFTLTIESEKSDFGRWIKCEAAEVVAECVGLYLDPESDFVRGSSLPEHRATISTVNEAAVGKDSIDPALLSTSVPLTEDVYRTASASADEMSNQMSTSMRRSSLASHLSGKDTPDSRFKDAGGGSPTFPPHTSSSYSPQLQGMLDSNKTVKSDLHQSLANDSVTSLSLNQHDAKEEGCGSAAEASPAVVNTPMSLRDASNETQVTRLQRQILLLQNDLSFERYLKQQHMAHIGDLRRRQMVEAAAEAETQNLIMMNRSLKSRYEEAKKTEIQVRKESEKRSTLAKKWEADLSSRLKLLREECKKTNVELAIVQKNLEGSRTEVDKLRRLLCDAEVKEVNWKQQVQSIEIQAAEVDRLRGEVERLTVAERDSQAKELERLAAISSATEAQGKLEGLRMSLAARENEVKRTKTLFQSQVASLQAQLDEALEVRERLGKRSLDINIENDLAASRARQAELEKQYSLLLRKYTVLQSSLLDMESGGDLLQHQPGTTGKSDDFLSTSAGAAPSRRRRRGLSNPESPETGPISFNVTPPLNWMSSVPGSPGASHQRPTTSLGTAGANEGGPSGLDQRFHGRGRRAWPDAAILRLSRD